MSKTVGSVQEWHKTILSILLAVGGTLFLFRETAMSMVKIWEQSNTFAHGYLIVPISLYMLWTRREVISQSVPRPDFRRSWILLFPLSLWLIAGIVDVQVVLQGALVLLVILSIWILVGWSTLYAMAFPLAYLFFTVPFGEFLIPSLMDYTAWFVIRSLELFSIPVYSDGRFITIPTGQWEVASACSGIRFLIASIALGCLYAYLNYQSLWKRALFIGLSVAIPIVANWIRALGIVMIGHFSGMEYAVGADHLIYGWVFFGIVMLLLFWAGTFWQHEVPIKVQAEGFQGKGSTAREYFTAAITVLLISASFMVFQKWATERTSINPEYQLVLPSEIGHWQRDPVWNDEKWKPDYAGATATMSARYYSEKGKVDIYIIDYSSEGQGRELINSQNNLFDESWVLRSEGREKLDYGGNSYTAHRKRFRSGNVNRVVWMVYDLGTVKTGNPLVAKLVGSWNKLISSDNGSRLIAVSADYDEMIIDADRLLYAFFRDSMLFSHEFSLIQK